MFFYIKIILNTIDCCDNIYSHLFMTHELIPVVSISYTFFRNSEAFTSELLENPGEMFTQCYMQKMV